MRVDGLLRAVPPPAGVLPQALISRIKILAGLNIAERRLPQDGAARVRVGALRDRHPRRHHADAARREPPSSACCRATAACSRSASSASRHATSSACARLLGAAARHDRRHRPDRQRQDHDARHHAVDPQRADAQDPHHRGSGRIRNSTASTSRRSSPAIGLTFATALRAFVRQDPDVIMVGEIRDAETANIAIHAALTGHLVLTTLHTETAAAARAAPARPRRRGLSAANRRCAP